MVVIKSILPALLLLCVTDTFAQSDDKDPAAVIELGGVPTWSLKDGASSFGPTAAIEVTAIENWLELEAGTTTAFRHHSTEWSTDLLFKKPWTLSHKMEFMIGIGPEWIHKREKGGTKDSIGVEVAPDFMFWPSARHRLGWYIEPSYDYDFGRGHEQSVAVAVGLLIGIR